MIFHQPLPEVLRSHSGGNSRALGPQPLHLPLYLSVRRYLVLHQEMINGYGDIISQGRYMAIQREPLFHDTLEGYLICPWHTVGRGPVTPLHTVHQFLVEGGFQGQECFYLVSRLLHPPPLFLLQDCVYCTYEVPNESLIALMISAAQTFVSEILHVYPKIHTFSRASGSLGL